MLPSDHSPYREPLVLIGYWSVADGADQWPDPADWIDPAWDETDRLDLALYLSYGLVARAFMGYSRCRICGAQNGNLELTDGVFVWPLGLAHYVRDHAVRLPGEFVEHVGRMESLTDGLVVDDGWWRSRAASR
ncbi:hypothetical protein [Oryzihumus sp.]